MTSVELVSFGTVTSWVVVLGLLVGHAARTLLPYWDKIQAGEIDMFNKKFIGTAVIAFIGSIVPTFAFFPEAMERIGPHIGTFGIPTIFVLSVLVGYGANSVVNYGLKRAEAKAKTEQLNKKISDIVETKVTEKLKQLKGENGGEEPQQGSLPAP